MIFPKYCAVHYCQIIFVLIILPLFPEYLKSSVQIFPYPHLIRTTQLKNLLKYHHLHFISWWRFYRFFNLYLSNFSITSGKRSTDMSKCVSLIVQHVIFELYSLNIQIGLIQGAIACCLVLKNNCFP